MSDNSSHTSPPRSPIADSEVEANPIDESEIEARPSDDTEVDSKPILDYIQSLPELDGGMFQANRLQDIINNATKDNKECTFEKLSLYLIDIFPQPVIRNNNRRRRIAHRAKSKRAKRRCDYAMVQKLFKKNRSRCIQNILDGQNESSLPQDIVEPFCRSAFDSQQDVSPPNMGVKDPIQSL